MMRGDSIDEVTISLSFFNISCIILCFKYTSNLFQMAEEELFFVLYCDTEAYQKWEMDDDE